MTTRSRSAPGKSNTSKAKPAKPSGKLPKGKASRGQGAKPVAKKPAARSTSVKASSAVKKTASTKKVAASKPTSKVGPGATRKKTTTKAAAATKKLSKKAPAKNVRKVAAAAKAPVSAAPAASADTPVLSPVEQTGLQVAAPEPSRAEASPPKDLYRPLPKPEAREEEVRRTAEGGSHRPHADQQARQSPVHGRPEHRNDRADRQPDRREEQRQGSNSGHAHAARPAHSPSRPEQGRPDQGRWDQSRGGHGPRPNAQQPRSPESQQQHQQGRPSRDDRQSSERADWRDQAREQRPERVARPKPELTLEQQAEAQRRRDEIFDKTVRFADLGLKESVLKGITEAGFEFPTAIQSQLIPLILQGKDMLGQAKTGTGKTASFGLPLLTRIEKGGAFQAMVLVPTRELAIQVATDLRELGRFTGLNILPVYGGQNVKTQAQLLSKGPEIIVATPGRVMDMQQRGYINYRNIRMVVLDEVDRMLDIGFRDDIRRILGSCPRERQTVFVSATINSDIESLARSFARNAEKIVASAGSLTVSMVKQYHLPVQPWDKKQLLLHLLTHEEPALTVVFCRTKKTVDNIAEYLHRKGLDCHAIHGDMYQNKRNKVMEQLRSGKLEVLVASDVASRGLDVEGITHVINYDLPEDPDLYVHRIGRTARAGRDGVAWSLVTPEQGALLTQIELLINAEIPKLDYPDFKPGPVPPDVLAAQQRQQHRMESARQFNRFTAPTLPATPGAAAAPPPPQAARGASAPPAPVAPPIAAADSTRFPGGIIPTKAPPKRMFGRVKTARSMRSAPPPAPAQSSEASGPASAVVTPEPAPSVGEGPDATEPLTNGAANS